VSVLPEAAVAPILIFVGLQITAQAFTASPARHGAAIAIAFVPAIAALVLIEVNQMLAATGRTVAELSAAGQAAFRNLLVLGNGFIITALLWGWALVSIIDGRSGRAAAVLVVCATATLFGLMHSPLPSGALFWPWGSVAREPMILAAAYGGAALLVLVFGRKRELSSE